ncbi:kinase-like domain-containing protein [Rhizophagus clarus]|uniref:Kinase-like domain-containing protein n=1 Tax=Rhizophagus clarus TaxID=94130 RepID=A0A8H3R0S7_9GLOM|nr:kinase-like domain-containing protein [Rhizophagus clarus]
MNHEQEEYNQRFGLCLECNQPNICKNWCKECNSKRFQQNFGKWTSGNEYIDKFIQEAQLEAKDRWELLEWIPYTRLRNIEFFAQGGFSTVYRGEWLDGRIDHWDYEKQEWKREIYEINKKTYNVNNPNIKNPLKSNENYVYPVVLKSLNDSSNVNDDFLYEWKIHLQCQYKARSYGSLMIPLYGITQDPDTLNYMIVMHEALGSLRNNLLTIKYNPNDKFRWLYNISLQLKAIHKLNLVHGDFHSGNILNIYHGISVISDLGLCKLVNQSSTNGEIYGVLPYIAPEVLRGRPYTKAADIYSLGIIMWEMTSGVPAFHDIPHNFHLSLDICKGVRPKIIEGTLPEYAELMKRCWDDDPKKRPTAKELLIIFDEWDDKYQKENDDKKRIPIPEHIPEIIIYHPESCYISKKIDYSTKLSRDDELSGRIDIDDLDNYDITIYKTNVIENLGMYDK